MFDDELPAGLPLRARCRAAAQVIARERRLSVDERLDILATALWPVDGQPVDVEAETPAEHRRRQDDRRAERDARIRRLAAEGLSHRAIAARAGTSQPMVCRVLQAQLVAA
jgi:hypothetical protein